MIGDLRAFTAAAGLGANGPSRRQGLLLGLKLVLTIGLLVVLARHVAWDSVMERSVAMAPLPLAVGLLAMLASVLFAALRWRDACKATAIRLTTWTALRVSWIGLFLGQVLPGALGTDVVRGWLTWKAGGPVGAVVIALVLDRTLALLGVALLFLIGASPLAMALPLGPVLLLLAAIMAAGMVALLLALGRVPVPAWLLRWAPGARLFAFMVSGARALLSLAAGRALLHAVAVHCCTVAAAAAFAAALGLAIGWTEVLAVVPAAILAAALPVSINGWGMREGAMVAGLAWFNVAAEDALLLSLLLGLAAMVTSLPGGLIWLGRRRA